jgi:cytochrome c-type biogenesis protein CcmH/NrfG
LSTVSITGRVLLENGQPPEELVQVNLVCNGRITQQTPIAPDGTFSFETDPAGSEDWIDPGVGGNRDGTAESRVNVARGGRSPNLDEVPSMGAGRVSLSGCEVTVAAMPGFTSNVIGLGTRGSLDDPDVGVLVLRRLSDDAGTEVSLNTMNAPKKARDAYDKASEEFASEKPNFGKAIKELEKATQAYPEFSAAWDLLARAHLSEGNIEEGRKCFVRAVEIEPKFIPPLMGLARLAVQEENWPEAAKRSSAIVALDSQYHLALFWNGLSSYYLADFDQAAKSLSSLYEQGHSETYPFGLLLLGVIHANQGQIQTAAEELNSYLELMPPADVPAEQRARLEQQISTWVSEGAATLPEKPGSDPGQP